MKSETKERLLTATGIISFTLLCMIGVLLYVWVFVNSI